MTRTTGDLVTAEEFDCLVRDFPGWLIWRSGGSGRAGWWWATRNRLLTEEEMYAEMHHTVCGEDAETLRGQLDQQATIEAGRAAAGR
ncbi:hypothetical protein [Actinoallomurus iriomotensis]|uniref:Uncharacterized protein n=1 Tax=Actinoallomurus iriomotensis TaxID=478107 RepID=A0A9W6S8Z5_9ACTN|nr:hypothetical protein [Actinoallomurus iriomotensis]GLY90540.1 hypothetical protein Airi02_084690 [Actinoallomurus iriomotensis]